MGARSGATAVRTAVLAFATLLASGAHAAESRCDASARRLTYADVVTDDHRIGIVPGDLDQFRARFAECTRSAAGSRVALTLELRSGGGNVGEAMKISRFLLEQSNRVSITTRVPRGAYCISACTFIFIAGATREVEPSASFEPHGFSAFNGGSTLAAIFNQPLPPTPKTEAELRKILPYFNLQRLTLMAQLFGADQAIQGTAPPLARDPAWAWLHQLFGGATALVYQELKRNGKSATSEEIVQIPFWSVVVLEGLRQLKPEQRLMLDRVERAVRFTIPELERDAVLREFLNQFRSEDDRRLFLELHAKRLVAALAVAQEGVPGAKPMAAPTRDALFAAALVHLEGLRTSRIALFKSDLLPYFQSRAERDIELDPFVRLMFSTSILYTRGLTREELCDLNIDNSRACDLLQ